MPDRPLAVEALLSLPRASGRFTQATVFEDLPCLGTGDLPSDLGTGDGNSKASSRRSSARGARMSVEYFALGSIPVAPRLSAELQSLPPVLSLSDLNSALQQARENFFRELQSGGGSGHGESPAGLSGLGASLGGAGLGQGGLGFAGLGPDITADGIGGQIQPILAVFTEEPDSASESQSAASPAEEAHHASPQPCPYCHCHSRPSRSIATQTEGPTISQQIDMTGPLLTEGLQRMSITNPSSSQHQQQASSSHGEAHQEHEKELLPASLQGLFSHMPLLPGPFGEMHGAPAMTVTAPAAPVRAIDPAGRSATPVFAGQQALAPPDVSPGARPRQNSLAPSSTGAPSPGPSSTADDEEEPESVDDPSAELEGRAPADEEGAGDEGERKGSPNPGDLISRPQNAFIIFSAERRKDVRKQHKGMHNGQLSVILAEEWRKMSAEEKRPYQEEASRRRAEFKKLVATNPDWKSQLRTSVHGASRKSKAKRLMNQHHPYAASPASLEALPAVPTGMRLLPLYAFPDPAGSGLPFSPAAMGGLPVPGSSHGPSHGAHGPSLGAHHHQQQQQHQHQQHQHQQHQHQQHQHQQHQQQARRYYSILVDSSAAARHGQHGGDGSGGPVDAKPIDLPPGYVQMSLRLQQAAAEQAAHGDGGSEHAPLTVADVAGWSTGGGGGSAGVGADGELHAGPLDPLNAVQSIEQLAHSAASLHARALAQRFAPGALYGQTPGLPPYNLHSHGQHHYNPNSYASYTSS
eukprot:tig00000984_g6005.t1